MSDIYLKRRHFGEEKAAGSVCKLLNSTRIDSEGQGA